jgi:hypothetical protein
MSGAETQDLWASTCHSTRKCISAIFMCTREGSSPPMSPNYLAVTPLSMELGPSLGVVSIVQAVPFQEGPAVCAR